MLRPDTTLEELLGVVDSHEVLPSYSRPYNTSSRTTESSIQLPSYGEATTVSRQSTHTTTRASEKENAKDEEHAHYNGDFDSSRQQREYERLAANRHSVFDDQEKSGPLLGKDELLVLREYDMVIVVDDSGSMTRPVTDTKHTRWISAQAAIRRLAAEAVRYDSDGIDVVFLNSYWADRSHVKSANDVDAAFRTARVGGGTYIGAKLKGLFTKYTQQIAGNKKNPPKKINYLIVTDGEASDRSDLSQAIVDHANYLTEKGLPTDQVGIQFVQIGNDALASTFLATLDDSVWYKPTFSSIPRYAKRDIVDTTKYEPGIEFTAVRLFKILLGGIDKRRDGMRLGPLE